MQVLPRWNARAAALVGFSPQSPTDIALGNDVQHLLLALWASADQAFCFRGLNGRLFIGLVQTRKPRKRRRPRR